MEDREITNLESNAVKLANAALGLLELYPRWRDDPSEEDLMWWDELRKYAEKVDELASYY